MRWPVSYSHQENISRDTVHKSDNREISFVRKKNKIKGNVPKNNLIEVGIEIAFIKVVAGNKKVK